MVRSDGDVAVREYTVNEVLMLYLRHSERNGVHGSEALADRRRTFAAFQQAYGMCWMSQVRSHMLADFIDNHPTWKSSSTRKAKAVQIKAAFQWAYDQERIDRNPFRSIRYQESPRRPDMADDTLETVCRLGTKPYEQALRFLRLTACRLSELCQCQWDQIDAARAVWAIPKHKTIRYTRKAKLVALVPEALDLLAQVKAAWRPFAFDCDWKRRQETWVFLNRRGNPWTRHTLAQNLRRMKARGFIDSAASLHGIRHRFGSAAAAAGAPAKLVATQMGHASVTTYERYYCDLTGELGAVRDAARLALPKEIRAAGA